MKYSTLLGAALAAITSVSFVAPASAQVYRDDSMPRHERVYVDDGAYVDRETTGSIIRHDAYSAHYRGMNMDLDHTPGSGDYYEGAFRPD